MTNYKRFISYLYFYEEGKKMGNVGFARVETSDEVCKVTIHCTTKVVLNKECKVYLIKRAKSSALNKQVGIATAKDGCLDLKFSFERGIIEGADFNVKETQGVVLMYSKDNYIAAKWDDSSVSYHEAILIEQGEEMSLNVPKVIRVHNDPVKIDGVHKTVMTDASNIEVVDETIDIPEHKSKNMDASNIIDLSKEAEKRDTLERTTKDAIKFDNIANRKNKMKEFYKEIKHEIVKEDMIEAPIETVKEAKMKAILKANDETYNKEITKEEISVKEIELNAIETKEIEVKVEVGIQGRGRENNIENITEEKISEVVNQKPITKSVREDEKLKEKISDDIEVNVSEEEIKEEETLKASNYAIPNPNLWVDHPSARAILNRFVRMYPFDDGEIAECVRLEPKDIGLLPMSAWVLGNNSFLLHAYCNFRHLLFAKKLTREGCVYLLMVPGAHNNREQQLAKMFGFEEFKCSRRRSMRDGEFGYWYVTISFD